MSLVYLVKMKAKILKRNKMTVNVTMSDLTADQVYHMELFLRQNYGVIDFKILPETKELYNKDTKETGKERKCL